MAFGHDQLQAVGKRGRLHGRQTQRFGMAFGRAFAAVELGGGGEVGRVGRDGQHVVAVGQPFVHALLDHGRRGRFHGLEEVFVTGGVAGVGGAARQQIALAAEAADAFDDARVLGQDGSLGRLQFGFADAILQHFL